MNNFTKKLLISSLIFLWLLSGWPSLLQTPHFPPTVRTAHAATETFTSSGTWTVPTGVTSVIVETWGGGGAGGKGSSFLGGGGGGAGGQYAKKTITVTQGSYSYTVGAGGTATSSDGNAGGDTTFGNTLVVAKGGEGGNSNGFFSGGSGGTGSLTGGVGDVLYKGGNGTSATTSRSGAGGGGAGSSGNGNNASTTTGGTAKTENGGAGGNGTTSSSSSGGAGNIYGAGGGGSRGGSAGAGAGGFIRLTYNSPPLFSIVPNDLPDSVTLGSSVTFSATATDSENNNWYLAVCKTNAVTPGSPPTCEASQTYCVSSSAVASGAQNSCSWTSSGTGAQNWYAFACDNTATNPICSPVNTTNSPVTVHQPTVISVSLSSDGTVAYGMVPLGQSKSTVQMSDTQTAVNDGNVTESFNIRGQNTPCPWILSSSTGTDQYVHAFSTNGGSNWTSLATNYQSLASSIAVGAQTTFDLQITLPTQTVCTTQQAVDVTIQAVQS